MRSRVALWRTAFTTVILLAVVVLSGRDHVFGEGGTWTARTPMPTARASLAVGVANGILYALGGNTLVPEDYLSTVEAYDPTRNTWTAKARVPTARISFAIGVANGILYAVGALGPAWVLSAR